MRPAIRCLLLGSILLAAGCRENVVLDASGDAALQSSLSRLAVTLPEKQREAFVADVLKLAFSDAELKQFLDVPHDRKPGVAYVPAGSYVRFRQWNGFALDQLGAKVKENKAAKPSAPAAPTLPSNAPPAVVSAETPGKTDATTESKTQPMPTTVDVKPPPQSNPLHDAPMNRRDRATPDEPKAEPP